MKNLKGVGYDQQSEREGLPGAVPLTATFHKAVGSNGVRNTLQVVVRMGSHH